VLGEFDDRERVLRVVSKSLELLRNQHQVRIKVPPPLADWLQGRVAELLLAFPRIQFLEVHADSQLPPDGCILETELGVLDASVETQLKAIERALIQAIR
jgi:type III secretion protein L